MPRVSHFEIDAKEPEKLVEFYTKVFNWSFEKWGWNIQLQNKW